MEGRIRVGVLVGCAAILVAASGGPARAGTIVYRHGAQIWAMNDDGSGQRPLATGSGATGLSSPSVDPNGGTVVAFEGSTGQTGVNDATGIYVWRSGSATATRVSPAPAPCAPGGTCGAADARPQPVGGELYFHYQAQAQTPVSAIYRESLDGSGRSDYGPFPCPGGTDVGAAQPNWSDPAQIAYAGDCRDGEQDGELTVSGAGGAGAQVVGATGVPEFTFGDFAFAPDGHSIVAYDGSIDNQGNNDAGLFVFPVPSDGHARWLLAAPFGGDDGLGNAAPLVFESPHFVGTDRIVLAARGDIWTVPAVCDACDFDLVATKLTHDGDDGQPAWTSANLVTPRIDTGGGGPPAGGGAPPGTPPPHAGHCAVPKLMGLRLKRARKRAHRAGCILHGRHAHSGSVRRGRVLAQRPKAGAVLAAGAAVRVTVSSGPRRRR